MRALRVFRVLGSYAGLSPTPRRACCPALLERGACKGRASQNTGWAIRTLLADLKARGSKPLGEE